MLDVILIQHGRAHEIWRDNTIGALRPIFHVDLIAQMVERPANAVQPNWVWDGQNFTSENVQQ